MKFDLNYELAAIYAYLTLNVSPEHIELLTFLPP